jgi:ADP-ribose pyrophosphatase YjhB (NUDIX family)
MISKNKKINEIFRQFLYADRLKFNEIEKKTKIRSNELAYLLKRMVSDGVLIKNKENYLLTEESEKQIPHFSESSETSPLPVVLILCVKQNKLLLIKRNKRPYKDYWSLVGGRIRTSETIKNATLRILKEKTFIDSKFISINAVVHEKYSENGKIKNAFVLFLTKVSPTNEIKEKEDIKWFGKTDLKTLKIVPSDLWLIENKLNSKIDVKEEILEENKGVLAISFIN